VTDSPVGFHCKKLLAFAVERVFNGIECIRIDRGGKQKMAFSCKNKRKTVRKSDFSSAVGAGARLGGNGKFAIKDDYTWGVIGCL